VFLVSSMRATCSTYFIPLNVITLHSGDGIRIRILDSSLCACFLTTLFRLSRNSPRL
jgi:hypothetical protein